MKTGRRLHSEQDGQKLGRKHWAIAGSHAGAKQNQPSAIVGEDEHIPASLVHRWCSVTHTHPIDPAGVTHQREEKVTLAKPCNNVCNGFIWCAYKHTYMEVQGGLLVFSFIALNFISFG